MRSKTKKDDDVSPWSPVLTEIFSNFKTPWDAQLYLNSLKYNSRDNCKSPEQVIKVQTAHCAEGAFFGAAALRFMGYEPLVLYMTAWNDDDHVIAIFKVDGCWGAVAKSNFTTLRFREPVYRSIRELIISYFDFFFNTLGEKTLRSYSLPLDLSIFDEREWSTTDEDLEYIGDKIEGLHHFEVVTPKMVKELYYVSEPVFKSGLMGSKAEGLYKPKK